ncbi:STM4015 family protein [Planomonospora sp. ID67723]|uniref:STM4015 family protein n=1 Tax=Planomonospora sp. ID67723 TaxID=2738134 RepID=UPI0018C3D25D|nr:STM4015 family protein [Planomonospora sp. ID67723]MBG0829854.1 STM4015 family protein [Planomonospora sp. ID67723]
MTDENLTEDGTWNLAGDPFDTAPAGDADPPIRQRFDDFMAARNPGRVRRIVVGWWGAGYEGHTSELPVRLLSGAADRLQNVRSIYLGDISQEQSEISWIEHGDVTPLLEGFPKLEKLVIRGSSGLRLRPVRHEALRVLEFESGGLPAEVVRAVGASEFPALENLDMWLGVDEYGGDATVADLGEILAGERLPSLRHLGLQNSEIQDEIAAAVASAPIVARLEALSLAMGTLTDAGAEALLSGQPLTHLRRLDLSHHYLTHAMMDRVRKALTGVVVDLSDRQEEEEDGEEVWRYVAVSE